MSPGTPAPSTARKPRLDKVTGICDMVDNGSEPMMGSAAGWSRLVGHAKTDRASDMGNGFLTVSELIDLNPVTSPRSIQC